MLSTRTPAPSRLPHEAPTGNRGSAIAKAIAALVAIVAIAGGVPWALYSAFGAPWPDSLPSSDWIYADFSPRDALSVLVVVLWLAWAHFLVCLLVEFVAERRGRGLSASVPGGSVGTQPLARRLVGAVLLLSGGLGATLPAATAVTVHTERDSTPAVAAATTDSAKMGAVNGPVSPQPVHGDAKPAGFAERSDHRLHKYVEVQPPHGRNYDTLWGIAERYLGDGMRYKEIAALNRGVVQPDGTVLKDPDLIYPGWILTLPGDADGPGLRDAHHSAPPRSDDSKPSPESGSDRSAPKDGSDKESASPVVDAVDEASTDSDTASVLAVGGFSAGGALLAAGLLFSLRRRRGWDGSPPPRGGKLVDSELDLRTAADESSSVFIDKVVRGLGQSLPAGAAVPGPSSGVLGVDGLALTFPAASRVRLDAPWRGDSGGRTWMVSRTDAATVKPAPRQLSPLPGLVAIGTRSDSVEMMLDVESIGGIVSLSGDLEVAREVAVSLGLELATNRWADAPRVLFVGFADDLTSLAPASIRHYDNLSTVFELIDAKRRRQHTACAAHGYESVRTGRLHEPDSRLWSPEFILLSGVPSAEDITRLSGLAADPRNAVGVILVGDVPSAPVRVVASSEGRLWCGPLGIDVRAHRVSTQTYRDALALFDAAGAPSGDFDPHGPDTPGRALAVPIVDPDALDLTAFMPVEVTTLGHLSVTGPGDLDEERRDLLTEIVVYLALHPEGVHPNVLAAAIWSRGVTDDVRDAALAQAATWLGVDAGGTPRLAIDAEGRWRLSRSGVRVDWDVFRALANRAATGGDPLADLGLALSLVTGQAWTGLPARQYGWLAHESVEADVRVAVVAVARRLAALAAAAGAPIEARHALLAGLRMSPGCEEIWRDALRLANTFAGPADVRAVADDMYAALARHGSPRGPAAETDALVDELIPGHRRSAA